MKTHKTTYISPEIEVIEMEHEGILCGSTGGAGGGNLEPGGGGEFD